jgi:WW domain-containing oxidoreductase
MLLLLLLQVNHLGPYTLTRLLEKKLVASKARVVNVVSVTHRITTIK